MPNALELMVVKSRRLSRADKLAVNRAGQENLLHDIAEIEQRASSLGVFVTARALNNAKNALGWEMAGNLTMAGKAARGVRHVRKRRRS